MGAKTSGSTEIIDQDKDKVEDKVEDKIEEKVEDEENKE